MLACDDIMPTGWTPVAASSTLEEWSRTFSRWQQSSCFRITVFYGASTSTRAIRRLKNGRAAGADGITAELLKGAEKPVSEALHKVITNVWSTGRVQAEGKEGIIVSLYKGKGSHSECSSYRPISLLSVSGKVFAHILLARIQPLYCDSEGSKASR